MSEPVLNRAIVDKDALERYRRGWQFAAELDELERDQMTVEQRLQQLDLLFQSAITMGIYAKAVTQNLAGAEMARQRWVLLKAKLA